MISMKKDCVEININSSPIQSRQNLLNESLKKFYNIPGRINILYDIVTQKTKLSLRLLDWLVTNYAKSKNVIYEIDKINGKPEEKQTFNMFLNYKTQLKAYSKKQFDPFCRRERINFKIEITDNILPSEIKTTIGQLNFFRWCIQNNIINYALDNLKDIELNMIHSIKHRKGYTNETVHHKKKRGRKSKSFKLDETLIKPVEIQENIFSTLSKKKRKELSISATKTFTKYDTKVKIEF